LKQQNKVHKTNPLYIQAAPDAPPLDLPFLDEGVKASFPSQQRTIQKNMDYPRENYQTRQKLKE